MAENRKPTFPCKVYGVTVYSVSEGREVCLKHAEEVRDARAAQTSANINEDIARYMQHGFPKSEATFLATGNVPCNSVSTFI